jgi:hypothetical protein
VTKTRQNKNLEPRSDSIGTEKALDHAITVVAQTHAASTWLSAVCFVV